jgi:hypothetical protein
LQVRFDFLPEVEIRAAFDGGAVTSDAGLLLVAQLEEEVGLLRSLAAVIDDPLQLSKCRHSTLELLTQRVMALVAGYEDCNDHTILRRDPGLKTATKRRRLLTRVTREERPDARARCTAWRRPSGSPGMIPPSSRTLTRWMLTRGS